MSALVWQAKLALVVPGSDPHVVQTAEERARSRIERAEAHLGKLLAAWHNAGTA